MHNVFGCRTQYFHLLLLLSAQAACLSQPGRLEEPVELKPGEFLSLTAKKITSIDLSLSTRGKNDSRWENDRINYAKFGNNKHNLPFGSHHCKFRPKRQSAGNSHRFSQPLTVGLQLCPNGIYTDKNGSILFGTLQTNYLLTKLQPKSGGLPVGIQIGLFGKTFTAVDKGLSLVARHAVDRESETFFSLVINRDKHINLEKILRGRLSFSSFSDLDGKIWLIICQKHADGVQIKQCQLGLDDSLTWLIPKLPMETFYRKVGDRHQVSHFSFTIDEIVNEKGPLSWINISEPKLDPPWTFDSPDDSRRKPSYINPDTESPSTESSGTTSGTSIESSTNPVAEISTTD